MERGKSRVKLTFETDVLVPFLIRVPGALHKAMKRQDFTKGKVCAIIFAFVTIL